MTRSILITGGSRGIGRACAHALANAGFIRRRVQGVEIFLDGPGAKMRDAVLAHNGDAASATTAFRRFTRGQQDALLAFVASL